MRYFICIFVSFFLISCGGNGTKNFSSINSMMMSNKGKVFVGREKGYFGSAQVYPVFLNGKLLGKLGNGETLVGNANSKSNLIEGKFGDIFNSDLGAARVSFVGKTNSNNYFILSYQTKITHGELKLYEVTENSFRNIMQ